MAIVAPLTVELVWLSCSFADTPDAPTTATTAEQLRTAQDTLLSGSIPRVQIRYYWQDMNWIDTLERREDGLRLIRIAHAKTPQRQ